ncbi:MAG: 2-oxoglutarate and iron-dependent oxygenase domain-containing protein [Acidimicrobiales bacterium]
MIDISPLLGAGNAAGREEVARAIDVACRDTGFFVVVGHGVPAGLGDRLDALAREFFALDDAEKEGVAMERGGRAWRGWFPLGGELTSGVPDRKEGIYFGAELGPEDERVRAGIALHGPNLFPARPAGVRTAVLDYMEAMTNLGHVLMGGIALALGLDEEWFAHHLTGDPIVLFRIFCYPPETGTDPGTWGVAEHTDYGLLTILGQDGTGGLQVRMGDAWVDVAPRPDAFVCNLGDMLERLTGGRYRSTPHRVRPPDRSSRLSFPFFFDPSWDAAVQPLPLEDRAAPAAGPPRWDHGDLQAVHGTYGDYLLGKVARVFPALRDEVLEPGP